MALIVENGSIVSGANSYVSLADAQQYVTDRAYEVTITEALLLRGVDYINSLRKRYRGYKITPITSSMQFPRAYLYVDNYLYPQDQVPDVVVSAQIETAVSLVAGDDPYKTTSSQVIKRRRADVFEIEYDTMVSPRPDTPQLRRVMSLLNPLLNDETMRVSR